ncbi:MAG: YidC/Oxa1 family insertase periplasmic-domain containing protein, partial [Gemmatimonadota bacterium]
MEKRLVLAVVLMMAVVFIVNVFFPPKPPPRRAAGELGDTTAATPGLQAPADILVPARETRADRDFRPLGVTGEAEPPAGEDTVWVNGPLYRLGFAQRGARLVVAELLQYESLAPGHQGQPVQLIPAGATDVLSHRLVVGQDTLDLRRVPFEIEPSSGIELRERSGERQLRFVYEHPEDAFRVQLSYTFRPGSYVIELQANLSWQGPPATGYWLIGLPPGLVSNEADPLLDYKANLAFAAHGPGRDVAEKLGNIEPGERKIFDGLFDWVAVRTKYFVTAIVLPLDASSDRRFTGLLVTGDT